MVRQDSDWVGGQILHFVDDFTSWEYPAISDVELSFFARTVMDFPSC